MSAGAKNERRGKMSAGQMGQGFDLGRPQHPLGEAEFNRRMLLELDQVVSQHIHALMIRTGDIAMSCKENETLKDMPDSEDRHRRALDLYSELAEQQLKLVGRMAKGYSQLDCLSDKKPVKV